ncbi:MAG: hypothetical protein ABIJ18_03235 [archaeon]
MSELTYDELVFPNYVNSNTAVRLRANIDGRLQTLELSVCDMAYAIELAGLNSLWLSDTGRGKTQLMSDIAWHHFGGDQEEGDANWADGRPSFDITDLFERTQVDLESGKFDSDTARQVKANRIRRMFFGVDEINRAPNPRQNEFFDLADGKYTFNGRRLDLGKEGYAIFMATANLNKMNGDFSGTFELDRALLNRAHVTIDLDHPDFRPTVEDEMLIEEGKANPKVDIAPAQNLSGKILTANKEIMATARQLNPYFTAFRFLIGRGLDYCATDKYDEKGSNFPMLCAECDDTGKDLCSRVKGSSERTLPAVKSLAYALSYIAKLKTGKEVEIDPLDATLQAFRFTTYHGNLNELMAEDQYAMRKQIMMDETVEKLSGVVDVLRPYLPIMIDGGEPVIVSYQFKGEQFDGPKTDKTISTLRKAGISYQEKGLKAELKEQGLGTDWIDPYVKSMRKK